MKRVLSILIVSVLTGCATPVIQQQSTLAAKTICCNSVKEFRFQPLATGQESIFHLDEEAPVFDFGRGKTYFAAAKLDEGENRLLAIRSHFNGIIVDQYLQPIITFLDENSNFVSEVTPVLKFFRETFRVNAHMGGAVLVPPNSRYIILSTRTFEGVPEPAYYGTEANIIILGNSPVITQSAGKSIPLTRAPTGEIWLKVLNQ